MFWVHAHSHTRNINSTFQFKQKYQNKKWVKNRLYKISVLVSLDIGINTIPKIQLSFNSGWSDNSVYINSTTKLSC